MKKYSIIAMVYAVFALACGVYFREFTKFNNFVAKTTLGVAHLHPLVLGCIVFLIVGVLAVITNIEQQKTFKLFLISYNIGLPFMTIMFLVRGSLQVVGAQLSNGINGMLSGIAGVSHIIMAVAIVLFFVSLLKSQITITKNQTQKE